MYAELEIYILVLIWAILIAVLTVTLFTKTHKTALELKSFEASF